jgi:hypothetical protein
MAQFNINTDAAVVMTNKLEKLHRSALPVAIRRTLDNAAFDVKTRTLLGVTTKTFVNRKKNFFKAKSRVVKAKGFNVSSMKSTVGFIDGDEQAVDDLEKQERGGSIKGRSFVPLNTARKGGTNKGEVENKYRTTKFKNVIRAGKQKGGSRGARFIKAAMKAGKGGNVIGQNGILFRVTKMNKSAKKFKFKARAIYDFKKGRSPRIKATHFMQRSQNKSAKMIPRFFNIEGKKQIKRLMR